MNYKRIYKNTDLNNPEQIETLLNILRTKNEKLDLFIRKDEYSHLKVRFNDEGIIAITIIAEAIMRECYTHAMQVACSQKKKTVQTRHIIGDGYDKLPLFILYKNLPHFNALVERKLRNDRYEAEHDLQKKRLIFGEKKRLAKYGTKCDIKSIKSEIDQLPSFNDVEVSNGNAVKSVIKVVDKKTNEEKNKNVYEWKNIDYDEDPVNKPNFTFYISKLFKDITGDDLLNEQMDYSENVKTSKSIKDFLNKHYLDFIQLLLPKLRLLINYSGIKTVDGNTVNTALKLILSDLYTSNDGVIELNGEHKDIFSGIEHGFTLLKNHTEAIQKYKDAKADEIDFGQ